MLTPLSPRQAAGLRRLFAEAGYSSAGLLEALGTMTPPSPLTRTLPRLLDQTRAPSLPNLLWRWFFLGVAVETAAAEELAPAELIAACNDGGLLMRDGERLVPTALLIPYDDLLFAADLPQRMTSPAARDLVLWLNPPAVRLLQFTLRAEVGSTLDLCSGSGIQALAAARHSREVVAADLNPRAAEFAAFNARLNGFENIECLTGDQFAAVGGRRFDRILCNPPFILAPSRESLHSHNDIELDGFCRQIVREAPAHLNDGGTLQMIFEWVELEDEPWQERLQVWFDGLGCDAWVLVETSQAIESYVGMRLHERISDGLNADVDRSAAWLHHFRQHRVAAVHGGLLCLRKRGGLNWTRFEPLEANPREPFGEAVADALRNFDFLHNTTDHDLLACKPQLAEGVRLVEEHRQDGDDWETVAGRLRQTRGLLREIGVSSEVAEFLVRCDGRHTVAQLADDLAIQTEAEFPTVRDECLKLVRGMMERVFLTV
jgi:hypothetical protein